MKGKNHLQINSEIQEALDEGKPVVALESSLISHGLPHPQNLEAARTMERAVRKRGAVPATIAIIGGKIRVGLTEEELEYLATRKNIRKVSRRDIAIAVAQGLDGATTVAATMCVAHLAGIEVMATGGIGGVHRGHPFDISADLPELAQTPVAVVCSGAKSILDLPATLEWLETHGVPVVGYGTDEFPAFYSRSSGLKVDARADSPEEAARIIRARWELRLEGGVLVVVPVPKEAELPRHLAERAIEQALAAAEEQGVRGKALTPFLLSQIARLTEGRSLAANLALLKNNAAIAARIAGALASRAPPSDYPKR
ncbi:MAG TPA: pseudouridine-5'-phosphate glycosidase [Anaerolineae bacterium]|nr:pseudouridine-5'-phosphate glycosidase [Anaerolineae bacterium]